MDCQYPTFDLMREHAVVSRICLIYERMTPEMLKKYYKTFKILPRIMRDFIENYHEKMEEKYIFPYIVKEKKLVSILIEQHKQSRVMTKKILSEPTVELLRSFSDMYRWHASMEDSVIFEEFKSVVPIEEQKKIAEIFEKSEKSKFGPHSIKKFMKMIDKVESKLL